MNELNTIFQAVSQEMYNAQGGAQAGPQGGAQANPGNSAQGGNNGGKDNVTDVDFEEVK